MKIAEINFTPDIVTLFDKVSQEEIENALRKAFPLKPDETIEREKTIREILDERRGKPRPEPIFGIEKSMIWIRNQNFLNSDSEQ